TAKSVQVAPQPPHAQRTLPAYPSPPLELFLCGGGWLLDRPGRRLVENLVTRMTNPQWQFKIVCQLWLKLPVQALPNTKQRTVAYQDGSQSALQRVYERFVT